MAGLSSLATKRQGRPASSPLADTGSIASTTTNGHCPSRPDAPAILTAPNGSPRDEQNFDAVDQFLAAVYTTRSDGLPSWTSDADVDAAATRFAAARQKQSLAALLAAAVAAAPQRTAELRGIFQRADRRDGKPTTERQGLPRPPAAFHSEAGRFSVLRTDWSPRAAELAVDWSRPELRLEFRVGRYGIFAGCTAPDVRIGGKPSAPRGPWEEVCWESNVDVDYLELEIALDGDVRLQRQFVLTRRDGLLYVADAVLLAQPADVETTFRLPTASGIDAAQPAETRELRLVSGRSETLVIPPLLPEWRSEQRGGELVVTEDELRLHTAAPRSASAYTPLVVVFDRKRARHECTWRRLTVGENLQIVAPDRAAGFRVQVGKEHWLGYRSLTDRANRTVLGVNLQTNFLLSRFNHDGESEPLVEIDH